jgi:hypothetical protein
MFLTTPSVPVAEALPELARASTAERPELEGCLSRGDRRTGWLLPAVRRFGWEQAVVQSPLNPAFILHRPRSADEMLPWDHLVWGIDRAGLRTQYEALLSALGEDA